MGNHTDTPPPPRKRYRTVIEIDHHGVNDLARELQSVIVNDLVEWERREFEPGESVGGHRTIRHSELEGWLPESDYDAALIGWFEATRKAR